MAETLKKFLTRYTGKLKKIGDKKEAKMTNRETKKQTTKKYNPKAMYSPKLKKYAINDKDGKIKLKPIIEK